MFGKPHPGNNSHVVPQRPRASDIAQIQGGGLVQVIVTALEPLTYALFLNDKAVAPEDVESLSVSIEAPEDASAGRPLVRATLGRYVNTVAGERTLQHLELFPCVLEIVAVGRRLCIIATSADSLDGLWIRLGLKPDGDDHEVSGARAVRILITDGILDAKLTWEDGETEDLLPQ